MNKRILLFWIMLLAAVMLPRTVFGQVVIERSTEIVKIGAKEYYMHHVKQGETLYSIAKAYQVTEAEVKKLNPEVETKGLQADMVLGIPVVTATAATTTVVAQEATETGASADTLKPHAADGYRVYTVEKSEKTKKLLKRLEVDEEEFRRLNPSVGSRVYEGQHVMIPVAVEPAEELPVAVVTEPDKTEEEPQEETPETQPVVVEEEEPEDGPVYSEDQPFDCFANMAHVGQEYHVALLVPLYLNDIDKLTVSKEKNDKSKNARPLRFLQFYEGFMMAVDSLTKYHGLRLDLTVIDVTENVSGAEAAVNKLQGKPLDMIIGPFFSKSFAVVQEFATNNNILIINPMTERETILNNAPNVVKLKPGMQAMVDELGDLIKTKYPKAKVTLFAESTAKDSLMVSMLKETLEAVVEPGVELSNAEMLDLITRESARRNMGKRVLSTLEVEGQIFSTKALKENPEGITYFENQFQSLPFSESQTFKNGLSSARDNVLIAYGNNIVYATKILNTINKSTKSFPITLIGLPNWADFDNLLVENLLNMNAIYFDNHFVDYNDSLVLCFVDSFRDKYQCEPMDYAFEGFDVGWYFLTSLMHFGPQPMDCLPYYHPAMLHSRYYFNKNRRSDGLDNRYWNIYQYDRKSVELKPIIIYDEEE